MQLQNLISEHVAKVKEQTKNIITRYPDSIDQDKVGQARQLQKLIYEYVVNLHTKTHKIIKGPTNSIQQDNKPISSKKYYCQLLFPFNLNTLILRKLNLITKINMLNSR
ncbi:hypothetical protein Hanom_Chr09g00790591 [Helianthus anomalus]